MEVLTMLLCNIGCCGGWRQDVPPCNRHRAAPAAGHVWGAHSHPRQRAWCGRCQGYTPAFAAGTGQPSSCPRWAQSRYPHDADSFRWMTKQAAGLRGEQVLVTVSISQQELFPMAMLQQAQRPEKLECNDSYSSHNIPYLPLSWSLQHE